MVTANDYQEEEVAACRAVLLEVLTVLGAYREAIVLVGGWVPLFSFPGAGHVGSLDVDVAIDEKQISDQQYATILESLRKAGYRRGPEPNQLERIVPREGKPPITVRLDLLAAEYGGTGRSRRHQSIQDIKARKVRGSELAFLLSKKITISGSLPDGSNNKVTLRIAEVVPSDSMRTSSPNGTNSKYSGLLCS
jgi:hypothetical protein